MYGTEDWQTMMCEFKKKQTSHKEPMSPIFANSDNSHFTLVS